MKERRMVQPGCWSPSRVKETFIRGTGKFTVQNEVTLTQAPKLHRAHRGLRQWSVVGSWGLSGLKKTFLRDEGKGQGKKGDIK